MEQEYKNIAIVGAGASGCICAYYLKKKGFDVTLFDKSSPLRTLLPTGGGRCNLAHAEYDFMELAKNYPRGEKFLYSVFSNFSTYDTLALFNEIGIETYTQEDDRIFPTSNSAKDVRNKILDKLKNLKFVKENVLNITQKDNNFIIKTDKAEYLFTDIIIAIGGHHSLNLLNDFELKIVPPKPSLVGLNAIEKNTNISGIVIKNVLAKEFNITDDLLFTHYGISGPLTYKLSAINARKDFPYKIKLNLINQDIDLQELLNNNSHKDVKNILSKFLPINFIKETFKNYCDKKAYEINGKERDLILNKIHNFELNITGTNKGEETVTAGGICLDEINPKTMEVKKYKHLYFIGEVLDIDGFCGGFNLQNAWSTAFVASENFN